MKYSKGKSAFSNLMIMLSYITFFEVFEPWEMEGGRNIYVSMVVFVTYMYLYLDQYEYITRCVNQVALHRPLTLFN